LYDTIKLDECSFVTCSYPLNQLFVGRHYLHLAACCTVDRNVRVSRAGGKVKLERAIFS